MHNNICQSFPVYSFGESKSQVGTPLIHRCILRLIMLYAYFNCIGLTNFACTLQSNALVAPAHSLLLQFRHPHSFPVTCALVVNRQSTLLFSFVRRYRCSLWFELSGHCACVWEIALIICYSRKAKSTEIESHGSPTRTERANVSIISRWGSLLIEKS